MTQRTVDELLAEARALGQSSNLKVPLTVMMSEAIQVAKFILSHWAATSRRPGLESAGRKMSQTMADEIRVIRDELQKAQSDYEMFIDPKVDSATLIKRGREILSELTAVLEWYLDDGVEDENDARFAALKTAHAEDNDAASTLAQTLHDYASLASPLTPELDGLGNFDAGMIGEAFDIADQLADVPASPNVRSDAARDLKEKRDLWACLLQQRIQLVRAAARFVFRDFPEEYQKVASAYERRRRAAAKRARLSEEKAVG